MSGRGGGKKDKDLAGMGPPPPKRARGEAAASKAGANPTIRVCLVCRKSDQDVDWPKTPGAPPDACL
eukprot:893990-Pyramimonas_sp.AAC.1